jgi:hypothetical protein
MNNEYIERDKNTLCITHVSVLLGGLLAGLFVAYQVVSLDFDFTAELRLARELGIVSVTILSNYAKSKDLMAYIAIMGLPILSAIGAWLIWARREQRGRILLLFPNEGEKQQHKDMSWRYCLAFVIIVYIVCSCNINYFYQPNSGWSFLGEEGENLSWAHAILKGKVYGKDIFCPYGPLLIYPLTWAMKLFGTTMVTARGYALFLNLAAYGIIISFLYKTCRNRLTFIMAALVYLLAFSPLFFLSPNCTYLRVAIGVLPLIFTYQYHQDGRKAHLVKSGVAIGFSLLFSQEVGLCSALALACCMLLHAVMKGD